MEQADRERGARTHAAARGQIAVVVQLQAALEAEVLEDRAHDRMSKLIDGGACLDLAINQANAVLEERGQVTAGEIAVLVDAGRQHSAAMAPVPRRVVGAAAKEGNAKRRPADDHP